MPRSSEVRLSSLRRAGKALKEHAVNADANHDGRLTTAEVRRYGRQFDDGFAVGGALLTMHSWALRDLERASSAAVTHVQQKIDQALQVIQRKDVNDNGVIDAGSEYNAAKRLKTYQALSALVPHQSRATTDATKAAVDASAIPELNDYGKWFDLSTYPSTFSRADVLRQATGMDHLTDDQVADLFSSTKGAQAPKDFAAQMLEIGEDELENADDTATGEKLAKIFDDVSKAALKDFVPSRFKSVELAEHFIEEDGDIESRVLLARQSDNSWVVLTYQDFPF